MPRRPFFYARNTSAKRVFSRTLGREITHRARNNVKYKNHFIEEKDNSENEKRTALIRKAEKFNNRREIGKSLSKEFEKLCMRQDLFIKAELSTGIFLAIYVLFVFCTMGVNSDLIVKSWPFLFLIPLLGIFSVFKGRYTKIVLQKMKELDLENKVNEEDSANSKDFTS